MAVVGCDMSALAVTKTWKEKLNGLVEEYGRVAIGTFLVLWAISVAAIVTAIYFFGWRPKSADPSTTGALTFWGSVVLGYVALKTTTIPRILLTLAITPFVAKLLGRGPKKSTPQT